MGAYIVLVGLGVSLLGFAGWIHPVPRLIPSQRHAREVLFVGVALLAAGGATILRFTLETVAPSGVVGTGGYVDPISVTASQLIRAYERDGIAADRSYKGHVVVITGSVNHVGMDVFHRGYVTMKDERVSSTDDVVAYFPEDATTESARLFARRIVRIRCVADGIADGSILFEDCTFL